MSVVTIFCAVFGLMRSSWGQCSAEPIAWLQLAGHDRLGRGKHDLIVEGAPRPHDDGKRQHSICA